MNNKFTTGLALGFICLSSLFAPAINAAAPTVDSTDKCLDTGKIRGHKQRLQLNSLLNVYHGGVKAEAEMRQLVCMSAEQQARAQARFDDLKIDDQKFLKKHLKRKMLRLLALRDTDDDGILDFRIKELGAFMANDTDADNDGIDNLFDPHPQVAAPRSDKLAGNDQDKDGLPDHLDWSNAERFNFVSNRQQYLVDRQLSVYREYGIVFVQTDFPFSREIADMTSDVLQIFAGEFKTRIKKHDLGPNAKSITTALQYGVESMDVLAEVSPVNGQIVIYGNGLEHITESPRNLIAPFMILIHEFTHVIQNAMDYPKNQKALLKQNTHLEPKNFVTYVNRLGWEMDTKNCKQNLPDRGYVFHGDEPVAPIEVYKGTELPEIARICAADADWNEESDKIWSDNNLVTCYATDSVREWHAEYLTVTVLRLMYSQLEKTHVKDAGNIIALAQEKMAEDFGGEGYDYANAEVDAVNRISQDLKLSTQLLNRLNEKYLVAPFSESE